MTPFIQDRKIGKMLLDIMERKTVNSIFFYMCCKNIKTTLSNFDVIIFGIIL